MYLFCPRCNKKSVTLHRRALQQHYYLCNACSWHAMPLAIEAREQREIAALVRCNPNAEVLQRKEQTS